LHHNGAVAALTSQPPTELECQPGLPGSSGTDHCHQARPSGHIGQVAHLLLAPDERRTRCWNVVGLGGEYSKGGKGVTQARRGDLKESFTLLEVAHLVKPKVLQGDIVGEPLLDRRFYARRTDDLPPVRGTDNPSGLMDGQPGDVPIGKRSHLARVQSHTHTDRYAGGPLLGREATLSLDAPDNGVDRVVEYHEEGIPLRADLPTHAGQRRSQGGEVVGEQVVVRRPELAHEPRR
jgi:hypothetical protein